MRPNEKVIFIDDYIIATSNPVFPCDTIVVNTSTSEQRIGDGTKKWAELVNPGSLLIVNKRVQTDRNPVNDEILDFCAAEDKWVFTPRGCFYTTANFDSNPNAVFGRFVLVVEVTITGTPTGRLKIGNGVTKLVDLPWVTNDIQFSAPAGFPTGYGVEFNGTIFAPQRFVHYGTLQTADTPTGKFHRDDGTFANVSDTFVEGPPTAVDGDIPIFDGVTGKLVADSGVKLSEMPGPTGSVGDTWQINVGSGPILKNVGGILQVRNALDTDFANMVLQLLTSEDIQVTSLVVTNGVSSVEITFDGTDIFIGTGKAWTSDNDGADSGLDADTLDGYHASNFPTEDEVILNSIIFGG